MSIKKCDKGVSLFVIPNEIFVEIFQFVGLRNELLNLHLVCKRFYSILTSSEYLYKKLCLLEWERYFVEQLPERIMKKYYDNLYRTMYFEHNKYRFCHYGMFTSTLRFTDAKNVRDFDKKYGLKYEEILLETKKHFCEFLNVDKMTLEILFDPNTAFSQPSLRIFYPMDSLTADNEHEYKDKKDIVNTCLDHLPNEMDGKMFPRFYAIYQWHDDQCSGNLVKENTTKPILSCGGDWLYGIDENGGTIYDSKKAELDRFQRCHLKSFNALYKHFDTEEWEYEEKMNEEGKNPDTNLRTIKSLDQLVIENEDSLKYSDESLLELIKSRTGDEDETILVSMICTDTSRIQPGTLMHKVVHDLKFSKLEEDYQVFMMRMEQYKYYQTLPWNERNQIDREILTKYQRAVDNFYTEWKEKKILFCTTCCVVLGRRRRVSTRGAKPKFDSYYLSGRCMFQLEMWMEDVEHKEENRKGMKVHFGRPVFEYEEFDHKVYRMEFKDLGNKFGLDVTFHDESFTGDKSRYESIGLDHDW